MYPLVGVYVEPKVIVSVLPYVAAFPYASSSVIVNALDMEPCVTVGIVVNTSFEAAAALTVTVSEPVIVLVTVSVAVIDWLPAVFSVTENV